MIKKLDLSSWTVSKVKNMSYCFSFCASLEELNIKNWCINDKAKTEGIFGLCGSLSKIYCNKETFDRFMKTNSLPNLITDKGEQKSKWSWSNGLAKRDD